MSGEIVKPEEGRALPKGFDDLVSGLAANYEAEPELIKDVSLDERFVQTGVQAADVLLRMASMVDVLFKYIPYSQSDPQISFYGSMVIEKAHNYIPSSFSKIKILPKKGKVLISFLDDTEISRPWHPLYRMKPEPAFQKLERVYHKRKTLEGKAAVLTFYNYFLALPGQVYTWVQGLKKKQEARNDMIASQPHVQAEVINNGLEQIGALEQKLKVLVPDPLEEKFAQLEAGRK